MAKLLSKRAYLATFVEPMKRLEADESYKPIPLGKYVDEVIRRFKPPVTRKQLQVQHVYLNGDQSFYHVLIHYGRKNRFLVIVVDCKREAVHGHYLLDLKAEYGLDPVGKETGEKSHPAGAAKKAKSRKAKHDSTQQDLLDFLTETTKTPPQMETYESAKRRVQVATLDDYPKSGFTTFVTVGLSQAAVSSIRGLDIGFELTLTLAKADPDSATDLANAVLENLRLRDSGERRPFIEYNGIYAPGYPPHFLFTAQATCTPKISGQIRIGQRYVTFLAAIPLDDAELRDYDRSVPKLIARLKKGKRIAEYPRS